MAEDFAFEDLLLRATCAVRIGGQTKGTAWLIDGSHLLTAGHVLGKESPADYVDCLFVDDPSPHKARKMGLRYSRAEGIDCCVLELSDPITDRKPLPISLSRTAQGNFHLYGFGKTLVDISPGAGSFVGPYHPQNLTANRLFSLQTQQTREQGYSGAAVFSDSLGCVVAIQIEGTTVSGSGPQGTTVLAMPIYRIAQLFPEIATFHDALKAILEEPYWFHVYLSYNRGGVEESWLDQFFIGELRSWLRLELELTEDPQIFYDHNAKRETWDMQVAEAVRHSCCLVPILSAGFWRSSECLAEFESFRARQRNENVAVVLGVLFHETGSRFSGTSISSSDFKQHAYVYEGFRSSKGYGDFQHDVKLFARELAAIIRNVPDCEKSWPVIDPTSTIPPAAARQVRVTRPQL
jgi:hypothetical protein